MRFLFDGILIAFMVFMILKSSRDTILKSIADIVTTILTIAASCKVSVLMANMVFIHYFQGTIASKIEVEIEKMAAMFSSAPNFDRVLRLMPGFIQDSVDGYGLNTPANHQKIDEILLTQSPKDAAVQITEILAGPVIEGVFRALFLVSLFFGFLFIYRTMSNVLTKSIEIPTVSYVDPIFGGVFGATRAVMIICVFVAAMGLVIPALSGFDFISDEFITQSVLGKIFYEKNLLNFYIGNVKNIA